MRRFARLYSRIDSTTSTNAKVAAMLDYFRDAVIPSPSTSLRAGSVEGSAPVDPADAAWAVYFLAGGRPKRLIPVRRIAQWAMEVANVPEWLFDECYHSVGDLAETIALLLPQMDAPAAGIDAEPLHRWVSERLLPLATMSEDEQRVAVLAAWRDLSGTERYIWNKLITGSFRVGVSEQLVARALSQVSGVDEGVIAHRLSGHWTPTAESFSALVALDSRDADVSRPFPFYLAYAFEGELESLGDPREWQAEWKWDGIRAQVIRREGRTYVWSRGGELVTDRFPELAEAAAHLPDGTVLDGEIMPWKHGAALPFAQLQRRIGRKTLGPKILADVPVVLVAYDLLELEGRDLRGEPLSVRRDELARVVERASLTLAFVLSSTIPLASWEDARAAHRAAREQRAEGLMLKRLDSEYGVGRRKGAWWKWKVEPFSVDAVMIYAQPGHGRRALLHTDYTFALREGDALVPFAKAYSGLTDAEIRTLDAWIRRHTVERFGPVRQVEPVQVFELAFEGIQRSPRHKSGVAVRFPRIARWRTDKTAAEADTMDTLRAMLEAIPT
jgi:DNA ligase 1